MRFCLILHIHLTSCHRTPGLSISTTFCRENASTSSRRQKIFYKFVKSQSMDFYTTGINQLISHWQKCVDCNGVKLFSKEALTFCILTSKKWEFLLIHTLARNWYCQYFRFCLFKKVCTGILLLYVSCFSLIRSYILSHFFICSLILQGYYIFYNSKNYMLALLLLLQNSGFNRRK